MNTVLENIKSRHSTRDFTALPVSREVLADIVEAGKYAPTANNNQTRILTVISNPDLIKRTYTAARTAAGRSEDYCMYNPAALILCAENESDHNGISNCACAMQNMMLAAESLGVGAVWINQFKDICNAPEIRALLDDLSIPKGHVVWAALAVGNPAVPATHKSKDDFVVTWFE